MKWRHRKRLNAELKPDGFCNVDSMRQTRNVPDPAMGAQADLLAVSFDPARDDVATLRTYVEKHKLDPAS